MFLRSFFVFLLVVGVCAHAQEPLNAPVPFVADSLPGASPGSAATEWAAARAAQEAGLDSIAANLYGSLLTMPGVDRNAVRLALATVLLDDGRSVEAEAVLRDYSGTRGSAWHLRAALAAAQQKRPDLTRREFDAIKPEQLSRADFSWFNFLQGMMTLLTDPLTGLAKAESFFQIALETTPTEIAKTRFQLTLELTRLRLGTTSDLSIEQTRGILESNRGRARGYEAAGLLASMLDAAGRKPRAIEVLQDQLRTIPANETEWFDHFRLLLAQIAGAAEGVGRTALIDLLEKGTDLKRQRIGLHLLARSSQTGAAKTQFRAELDKFIQAVPLPKFLEDLLLFRAQLALSQRTADGYAQAENDANTLRQKFPASVLVPHAYTVLMASAWEQRRYRIAADNATKARDLLAPGIARAELGVLIAEAWFRAGRLARSEGAGGAGGAPDFRNAAEAYAEVLRDPPPGVPPADLMFQHILAEIEGGSLEGAESLVDRYAKYPTFHVRNRWQAEWNLARAFQAAGKVAEAFARVSRVVGATAGPNEPPLSPGLRAQMAWLRARLSFDFQPSDETLALIEALAGSLEGLEPEMKTEIASTAMLLKAQTNFALGRDAAGDEALELLQRNFADSPAAIHAYIVRADRLAQQENGAAEAQNQLTKLAEKYPQSKYAPYALFLAAEQAELRGQKENFEEAVRRIEELIRLEERYPPRDPADSMIFPARFKQGDLLRRLGQFSQARDTYQSLIHNYPNHGDVIPAQLALAQCLSAEAGSDPAQAEQAVALFEHLLARLDASVDVRVEAGYNLGYLYSRRSDSAKALEVWWRDVVHAFLLDETMATKLGATGRYWMARTLKETAEVLKVQNRFEEARAALDLIVRYNLQGQAFARQQLGAAGLPVAPR